MTINSNLIRIGEKNIIYSNLIPDKNKFFSLFETTGWNDDYNLSSGELISAISSSWHMIAAYKGDVLIGFGRIISDGILHALIVDMIVAPELQSKGIGAAILKSLIEQCKKYNIRDIQLFCARGKAEFYKKNGFAVRPFNSPGMELFLFRGCFKFCVNLETVSQPLI